MNALAELAANVRYEEQVRDAALERALDRTQGLLARLDKLVATERRRPDWIHSRPVWPAREPVSMPVTALDVAFAQLADSKKAA